MITGEPEGEKKVKKCEKVIRESKKGRLGRLCQTYPCDLSIWGLEVLVLPYEVHLSLHEVSCNGSVLALP